MHDGRFGMLSRIYGRFHSEQVGQWCGEEISVNHPLSVEILICNLKSSCCSCRIWCILSCVLSQQKRILSHQWSWWGLTSIEEVVAGFTICKAFSVRVITANVVFAVFYLWLLSAVVRVDSIFRGSSCAGVWLCHLGSEPAFCQRSILRWVKTKYTYVQVFVMIRAGTIDTKLNWVIFTVPIINNKAWDFNLLTEFECYRL